MSIETTMFGPFRAIGLRYTGKNENREVMQLWGQLLPQRHAIAMPKPGGAFGVCRCLPGVLDGSFEYLAAFEALSDAPVPAGMVSVDIPRGEYFSLRFETVKDYRQAWDQAIAALAADPAWTGYCNGPDDCQCAAHPSFEYYPPEFCGSGPVCFCIPVHRQ